MVRKLLISLFFATFLLLNPARVYAADVVINEIYANPPDESNEFVELYNTSSNPVVITGWTLADTAGSTNTYTLPDTTIGAGEYKVFKKGTTGITLNNDNDGVTLKNGSSDVDSTSYSSTISAKSWSRNPNGTGGFVNNTDPTEGSSNASPPAADTPTPTKTPTPTNSPTPTKTPTPAASSTPTKTPTPSKSLTPTTTPVKSLNPSDKPPTPTNDPDSNLAIGGNGDNPFEGDATPIPEQEVLGASTGIDIPWIFIGLGLIFLIVCGILAYFQFGDKILPKFLKKKHETN
jgi:hypothetical protein